MTAPTGADVAAFLGQGDDTTLIALAGQHVTIITAMARAYVRGEGFTETGPADDIAAVITTATARLVTNPEQLESLTIGSYATKGGFQGWTLAELFVLNRYRKKAL